MSILVTGSLTPDSTGVYIQSGTHNGQPYYGNGSFVLWFTNDNEWWITPAIGNQTTGGCWSVWEIGSPSVASLIGHVTSEVSGSGTGSSGWEFEPSGGIIELFGAAFTFNGEGVIDIAGTSSSTFAMFYRGSGTILIPGGAALVLPPYTGKGKIKLKGSASYKRGFNYAPSIFCNHGDPLPFCLGSARIGKQDIITLSGTGKLGYHYTGSGVIDLSGLATIGAGVKGSGIISFAGTGHGKLTLSYATTGKINLSGTALSKPHYVLHGSGVVAVAGHANAMQGFHRTGGGVLSLAGAGTFKASYNQAGAGVVAISGHNTGKPNYRLKGSGLIGLAGGGAFSVRPTFRATGSGKVNLLGGAAYRNHGTFHGAGVVSLAGNATLSTKYNAPGSGQIQLSGTAEVQPNYVYLGSGKIVINGNAILASFYYNGFGAFYLIGSAYPGFSDIVSPKETTVVVQPRYTATVIVEPHYLATVNIMPHYNATVEVCFSDGFSDGFA